MRRLKTLGMRGLLIAGAFSSIAAVRGARKHSPYAERAYQEAAFHKYAVTSELKSASEIGKRLLERGGNALDAAIGTLLCIGAVNSFSSGVGGGGFLLLSEKSGKARGYDFRETAPKNVDSKMFKNPKDSLLGGKAVAVPGEILGLYTAHKEHGRLPWKDLFADVIELLTNGFVVEKELAARISKHKELIRKDREGLAKTYLDSKGEPLGKGEKIKRPNLAATLKILADNPLSLYTGDLASKLVEFVQSKGGTIEKNDLEGYVPRKTQPMTHVIGDMTILSLDLPTSGYMVPAAISILHGLGKNWEQEGEAEILQTLIEVFNHLFSLRSSLEDEKPGHTDLLNRTVLSDQFLESAIRGVQRGRLLSPQEYATKFQLRGKEKFLEDRGTTHVNVVDSDGMAVSVTSTINDVWGAGIMDPVTGIIPNNEIDDFVFPAYENSYGLSGKGSANQISPGKRPLSSSMPTIIKRRNETVVIGGAGGIKIPTSVISTLFYLFFMGYSMEKAIAMPKIHSQLFPDVVVAESSLADEFLLKLLKKGYTMRISPEGVPFTSTHGILVKCHPEGDCSIDAVSDRRKGGVSSGE